MFTFLTFFIFGLSVSRQLNRVLCLMAVRTEKKDGTRIVVTAFGT